ncbi:MAG: shikimate kinase [Acidimicrobiales bacterium]
MPEHVLVIGMMGAGKTTVGQAVASAMRRPFRDSDEEILAKTGMSVPEIFSARGEPAFRAEERAVLAFALSSPVPSVIAVAGGAVFNPDSRRRIRNGGVVVWLRARPPTLAGRVGGGSGRPLLERDPVGSIARLDAMRRPVYRSLADLTVDVDGLAPGRVAERVTRLARSWLDERSDAADQAVRFRLAGGPTR